MAFVVIYAWGMGLSALIGEKQMDQRVELLAPAGNMQGFYGAIHAGADAVYLGGSRFSARAYADNFTQEELLVCIRYAHIWGRRVYLTVNTLIKETEFDGLLPFLLPLYENGLDGVIVQDIGVFAYIREHFPDMELHVSTQMTLTGQYGARLLGKMGAVRIVPARELSLAELRTLKEATGLQIEAFIHGAMCYCYSGQCLFSSILGGRSGNRGRCAQPCRLLYRVGHNGRVSRECYPLSLKDMCTIGHIPALIGAGIDSFKIEGRMKKPEYAAGVTAIYRKYIDLYYNGEYCGVEQEDMDALSRLYIRSGRQDGYYYRHNGRDMVTLGNPSYSGNDEALLEDIRARYLAGRPHIPVRILAEFRIGLPARITLSVTGDSGGIPALNGLKEVLQVTVEGDEVPAALKQPIAEDNIRRQLDKLKETVFSLDTLEIVMDEGIFYPLKSINVLRRQAVAEMEDLLIRTNGFPVMRQDIQLRGNAVPARGDRQAGGHFHVLLRTVNHLDALIKVMCSLRDGSRLPDRIYLEADLFRGICSGSDGHLEEQLRLLQKYGCTFVIALPAIIRERDESFMEELWTAYCQERDLVQGFMVRSMDGLGYLDAMREKGESCPAIYTDAGLYVWNSESLRCLQGLFPAGDCGTGGCPGPSIGGFCLPYELKAPDQHRLLEQSTVPAEKVVYGRIPLMVTANCIVNTMEGCDKGQGRETSFLLDRHNKQFPVLRNCRHCMNIIYNSLPLSLHKELGKWQNTVDFRLDFTVEDGQETVRILQYFLSGAMGKPPYEEYTTGHERRGAE